MKQKEKNDGFIDEIQKIIKKDIIHKISQKDIKSAYISKLASKWLEMNVRDRDEFERKIQALGRILSYELYQSAVDRSVLALNNKNGYNDREAEETANLIKKLRQTDYYKIDSQISGYRLLDKYEEPETYKRTTLKEQRDTITQLFEYLQEIKKQNELEKSKKEMEL